MRLPQGGEIPVPSPAVLWFLCRELLTHPNWVSFAQHQSPSAAGNVRGPVALAGPVCITLRQKIPRNVPKLDPAPAFPLGSAPFGLTGMSCRLKAQVPCAILGLFSFSPLGYSSAPAEISLSFQRNVFISSLIPGLMLEGVS